MLFNGRSRGVTMGQQQEGAPMEYDGLAKVLAANLERTSGRLSTAAGPGTSEGGRLFRIILVG